jgi:hypothetical protein
MTDQHPIAPPLELVKEWKDEWYEADRVETSEYTYIANQAARWGADQELEACCSEISFIATRATADNLRSLRRPKPPSLRKQACDALDTYVYGEPNQDDKVRTYNTIRAALEALPHD